MPLPPRDRTGRCRVPPARFERATYWFEVRRQGRNQPPGWCNRTEITEARAPAVPRAVQRDGGAGSRVASSLASILASSPATGGWSACRELRHMSRGDRLRIKHVESLRSRGSQEATVRCDQDQVVATLPQCGGLIQR